MSCNYRKCAESLQHYSITLLDMITKTFPELSGKFELLTDILDEKMKCDYKMAQIVERCGEDLNDIVERKKVMIAYVKYFDKIESEYKSAKTLYEINKGKPREIELKVRTQLLQNEYKVAIEVMINKRTRFPLFATRRICHAFSFFIVALQRYNEKLADIMQRIILVIGNVDELRKIIDSISADSAQNAMLADQMNDTLKQMRESVFSHHESINDLFNI